MLVKISKNNILFYLAFFLYYFSLFITVTSSENSILIKYVCVSMSFLLLLANIITKKGIDYIVSRKGLLLLAVIAGVLCYSVIYQDFYMFMLIMFVSSCEKIEYKRLFRCCFNFLLCCTVCTVALSFMGMLTDNTNTINGGVIRHSVGFYHSNVLPQIVVYLLIYWIVGYGGLSYLSFVIFGIVAIIVYLNCYSRNGLYSVILTLLLCLIYKIVVICLGEYNKDKFSKLIKTIGSITVPVVVVIAFWMIDIYRENIVFGQFLNELFNNRLYMGALYFKFQPIKFVNLMTYDYFERILLTLDNAYYYAVARYGVVFIFFICLVFKSIIEKFYSEKNILGILCCIILAFVNFIDNGLFNFLFYPFYLVAFQVVFYDRRKRSNLISCYGSNLKINE